MRSHLWSSRRFSPPLPKTMPGTSNQSTCLSPAHSILRLTEQGALLLARGHITQPAWGICTFFPLQHYARPHSQWSAQCVLQRILYVFFRVKLIPCVCGTQNFIYAYIYVDLFFQFHHKSTFRHWRNSISCFFFHLTKIPFIRIIIRLQIDPFIRNHIYNNFWRIIIVEDKK